MPPDPRLCAALLRWQQARDNGRPVAAADACADCPDLLPEVERLAALLEALRELDTSPPTLAGLPSTLDAAATRRDEAVPAGTGVDAVSGHAILEEACRGAMGVVYKARQLMADRLVALKVVEADPARFRTEVEAVARLSHPHIVRIYEVGEAGGQPFFTMEYCPGGSLEKKLSGKPLPPREAAALLRQVAEAVQAAHDAGIVHRDLKPANVLLAADGSPRVADFSLARKMDEASATVDGAVVGTPAYMSPEQALGYKSVGPPADVWALGAILYECLTGRPPFQAAGVYEVMAQVVKDDPVPPGRLNRQVPPDLGAVCLKCLEKEPAKRYQSARALADDLGRAMEGRPTRARPVGAAGRAWRWCRRNPAVASLLFGVVLSVALGVAGVWWKYRDEAEQRRVAEGASEKAKEAERRAREVADVMVDIFRDAAADQARGKAATVLEGLDLALGRLRVRLADKPELKADLLARVGGIFLDLSQPGRAVPLLREALAMREGQGDTSSDSHLALRGALGRAYGRAGDYPAALAMLRPVLADQEGRHGWGHEATLETLGELAAITQELGDYEAAGRGWGRLLEIARDGGKPRVARAYAGLGRLKLRSGDAKAALPLLLEAVANGTGDEPLLLGDLAAAHAAAGNPGVALSLARKAVEQARSGLGVNHPDTARLEGLLASALSTQGKTVEALALLDRAAESAATAGGEGDPNVIDLRIAQAMLLAGGTRADEAARRLIVTLVKSLDHLDRNAAGLSRRQAHTIRQRVNDALAAFLAISEAAGISESTVYEKVLECKGRLAGTRRPDHDDPKQARLLAELREADSALAALVPGKGDGREHAERLSELGARKEALEARLAELMRGPARSGPALLAALRKRLVGKTALVDFVEYAPPSLTPGVRTASRLVAFVVAAGRGPLRVLLGETAPIEAAVAAFRRRMERGVGAGEEAGKVMGLVWQPLVRHLGGMERVYISPDGPLFRLPFGGLPGTAPGTFLIEKHTLSYLVSAPQLLEGGGPGDGTGVLVLGGLNYGDGGGWHPLPGTKVEGEAIAGLARKAFPREAVTLLEGKAGDKAGLVSRAHGRRLRWLHVASHGFVTTPNRLAGPGGRAGESPRSLPDRYPGFQTGLVVARGNEGPVGLLTAEEMVRLDLRGCECAVLSACEMALGKVAAGEGSSSLVAALHEANVKAVIASLWSVNDAATAVLMERFHHHAWEKKLVKTEALRQAQLDILRNPKLVTARMKMIVGAARGLGAAVEGSFGKDGRSPPHWWAGFVLSGVD